MRRFLKSLPLLLLLVLAIAYGAISWQMASAVTEAERKPLEATPASVGLDYQEVSFPSRRGDVTLKGWYIPVAEGEPTIIIVHGVDSNRASQGVGILDIARGLADKGLNLLLFDLRAHGESGGEKMSGGYFEQQDLLGAFDFLVERGIPPDQIGVLGFSLGGAVALLAAGQEPDLRAVVADSPFADISDLIVSETRERTDFPDWMVPALVPGMVTAGRLLYGIDINAIAPVKVVPRLDFPILLIHGLEDDRVPPSHSQRLKAASRHPDTELWLVPGAEHTRNFKAQPEEYIARVAGYFLRLLWKESCPC
jgi:dipeptidyl aminopeptidase/acylaminoacyl peptidase